MNEETSQKPDSGGQSTVSDEINVMVQDFADFAVFLGRKAGKVAEDLSGLMVVRVGAGERADLDVLVDAGIAKTRGEAALRLLADGVKANGDIYQRVERTREQIQALRGQLKDLIGSKA